MKLPLFALLTGSFSLIALSAPAGPWVQVASPALARALLNSVSAIDESDVWAVGFNTSNSSTTVAEHWDGTAWSVVATPNPSRMINVLTGVAAVASNNVWAVGYQKVLQDNETLIEHWNGKRWTVIPSPNVTLNGDRVENELRGISAISARDIWAVGFSLDKTTNTGGTHPLAEHWDGRSWTIITTPSAGLDSFAAVEAISSNDVWAVGVVGYPDQVTDTTLTQHWDGAVWSVVPSPNGMNGSTLDGVSAIATNDVWAVGYSGFLLINAQTLALHWNGSVWSAVPTPAGSDHALTSVIALASNDVWSVGADYSTQQSLSENWNGSAWSSVTVPAANPPAQLSSVTATPNGTLWAVGNQSDGTQPVIYEKTP